MSRLDDLERYLREQPPMDFDCGRCYGCMDAERARGSLDWPHPDDPLVPADHVEGCMWRVLMADAPVDGGREDGNDGGV